MGDKVAYAGVGSQRLFGEQLGFLASELRMPMPMFKGKRLHPNTDDHRWEIQTIILEDPYLPNSKNLSYTGIYISWQRGVDIAMHEALSRMCNLYKDKLKANSVFREFGKRDAQGEAVVTPGNRNEMFVIEKHLEDLEIHAVHMEELLDNEMTVNNQAKAIINARDQEIQALQVLNANQDHHIAGLMMDITAKDAQIAALQAQLNPPPPPHDSDDDDDSDDEDDDDDGGEDDDGDGDEGVANAEAGEEEDPEEAIHYVSDDEVETSDEEYTPATRKRKCVRASAYIKRFKSS